ncbi:MAG: hypothetical protein ABIR91_01520 [Candidatus Saccharimonadales bacterium]
MESDAPFDDNDLYALIDNTNARELTALNAEATQDAAANKLWETIEQLETPLFFGRGDEAEDDELVEELVQIMLSSEAYANQYAHLDADEQYNIAIDDAESYYAHQQVIVARLFAYMVHQLQLSDVDIVADTSKKQFMATLIVENNDEPYWAELSNVALTGDALDPKSPADEPYIEAAQKEHANRLLSPANQLARSVRRELDIPADFNDPETDYTEEQRWSHLRLNDLADAVVDLALEYSDPNQHGELYKQLHVLFAEFDTNDEVVTKRLTQLAAEYTPTTQE